MRIIVLLILASAAWLEAAIPTPESHFGHPMGQDKKLLDWAKVVSYFQALGQNDPRVRFAEIGKTVQGRPMIVAVISSEANMKELTRYHSIQRQLADPRVLKGEAAEKLIAQGKAGGDDHLLDPCDGGGVDEHGGGIRIPVADRG